MDLDRLMQDVDKHCGKNILVHVVGNKIDLTGIRQVSIDEGKKYADNIGAKFIGNFIIAYFREFGSKSNKHRYNILDCCSMELNQSTRWFSTSLDT